MAKNDQNTHEILIKKNVYEKSGPPASEVVEVAASDVTDCEGEEGVGASALVAIEVSDSDGE